MISLYDAKLIDLMPPSFKTNPDMMAACEMEDQSFYSIARMARKVLILPNLEEQDESVLDNLSWQLNVDFYEANLPIEKKLGLIQNAIKFKMSKGTAGAVEDMLAILFDVSSVEEWFEYGGDPYMFKIKTTDVIESNKYGDFKKVIQVVKNTRSHLESFLIDRQLDHTLNVGVCIHKARKLTVYPEV